MDELDDLLGGPVSGRSLAGEDVGARRRRHFAALHDAQVIANDAHHVQQLPLVLVDALDLHVEHRIRIDNHASKVLDNAGQLEFVLAFHFFKGLAEVGIVDESLQVTQPVQVGDPLVFVQGGADEIGQPGIGQHEPAAGRYAIRLIVELIRPNLCKFRH